jgi:uncharacterized protein (DUF169 family)
MEKWRNTGARLEEFIRPATFPVAVRFLGEGEEPPEKARRPLEETGGPIAICQGLTLTRRRGLTMAFGLEDSSCALATVAYGWDDNLDPRFMTTFFEMMNYARDEIAAKNRIEGMARLKPNRYPMLVLSPLARTRVQPHLILIYANPAQIMRLVHAATSWTGERVPADFGGIAGSCNEGILRTFIDDMPRVALPGNGDRVFAATQDDELIFAFPAAWSDKIIDGLEATAARGVRFPVPTLMDYQLPFADLMERYG